MGKGPTHVDGCRRYGPDAEDDLLRRCGRPVRAGRDRLLARQGVVPGRRAGGVRDPVLLGRARRELTTPATGHLVIPGEVTGRAVRHRVPVS